MNALRRLRKDSTKPSWSVSLRRLYEVKSLCAGSVPLTLVRPKLHLERLLPVFVEVFGAFGRPISESKTESMCMPIPRTPTNSEDRLQRHGASVPLDNLLDLYWGGAVTGTPNLLDEIDRRIRVE